MTTLEARAEKIVDDGKIVPDRLKAVIKNARENPAIYHEVVDRLLREGFLTQRRKGNYGVYTVLFPDFFIGPQLGKQRLYFKEKTDAETFVSVYPSRNSGLYGIHIGITRQEVN